jgi:signal transduction histidine kinase
VEVEISDEGKGIAPHRLHGDKVVPGVGIMGIQERMRQFGGSAEIKSSEKGTVLAARIPLKDTCEDSENSLTVA